MLFVGLPCAMLVRIIPRVPLAFVALGCVACATSLALDPTFNKLYLWNGAGALSHLRATLITFVVLGVVCTAVVAASYLTSCSRFPANRPFGGRSSWSPTPCSRCTRRSYLSIISLPQVRVASLDGHGSDRCQRPALCLRPCVLQGTVGGDEPHLRRRPPIFLSLYR